VSKIKVSIIGGSGFLAAELLRRLLVRDDVQILRISSKDHIGKNIGEVNRSFWGMSDLVLEDIPPQECVRGADIVFLAMPHVITAKVAMQLFDLDVRIIDLSGDFRLQQQADYTRYYADKHPCPEGCFATCIATSMLPLASAGLMENSQVHLVAMTGSSGSGVHPQAGNHHAVRVNNLKTYKVFDHQHTPEILQTLKSAGAGNVKLDFVPVSAPLSRGMMSITQMDLPSKIDESRLRQLYQDYYKKFPLVSVLPQGMAAEVVAIKNSARIEISIDISAEHSDGTRTLCVTSVLDNLIKGGAGQAMQNFNLMIGKENNYQLDRPGMWP